MNVSSTIKTFLVSALFIIAANTAIAQCTATITASGSTNLCPGQSVVLSANEEGDVWKGKSNFSWAIARYDAVSFTIGNKGYIGTGVPDLGNYLDAFFEYDPSTDTWTQLADVPGTARRSASGFSINGKGYIGLGQDRGAVLKDFYEYSPATNTWTAKKDFPQKRVHASAFSIGTKGYVTVGSDGTNQVNSLYEFDPVANTWTAKAAFPGGTRIDAVSFTIGTKGYVGTGNNNSDFYEYDPTLNVWTPKAAFPGVGRTGATGMSIGNKGYIGLGGSGNDFFEYNPGTNSWTQKATVPGQPNRVGACAFSIGLKGYIVSGTSDLLHLNDCLEYTPSLSYTWSPGGATTKAITATTAGNYTVTVTDPTGCSASATKSVVSYNTPPVITANGPTTFCKGGSVVLHGEPGSAGSYLWSTGAVTKDITVTAGGLYTFTHINPIGCSLSATASVVVNENPLISISPKGEATFCAGSSTTLTASGGNSWSTKANTTTTREIGNWSFSIGSKGYIGGVPYGFFWEYDPASDIWTQKASSPDLREAVGFSIGTKGYVGTGSVFNSTKTNVFWEYDPLVNSWKEKKPFAGDARVDAFGFSIGSKGYIGAGYSTSAKNDFWEYDPASDEWIQKANIGGGGRSVAVGFSIGNKGYIGTGISNSIIKKDFWEYNPATDTWIQKADFGGDARYFAVGFSIGTKGYIGTGSDDAGQKNDFWEYNPTGNTWKLMSNLPGPAVYQATAFSIGGKGYIANGTSNIDTRINNFYEYTPDLSYTWTTGQTTASIAVSTTGTYTVGATSTATGCVAPPASVVVSSGPPVITSQPVSISVCASSKPTLSVTANKAKTYSWYKSTTNSNVGGSLVQAERLTPEFSPNDGVAGTYYYYAVVKGYCAPDVTSSVATVVIKELPYGYIFTSISSPSATVTATICPDKTLKLYLSTNASSYLWNYFDNPTLAEQVVNPTLDPSLIGQTTSFNVLFIAANGCTRTRTADITVREIPTLTVTPSIATTCPGQYVTLTATGTANGTFLWNTGETGGYITKTPNATTTYSTTITDPNGCKLTKSATVKVESVSISPSSACIGNQITAQLPASATHITWSRDGVDVSSADAIDYTATGTVAAQGFLQSPQGVFVDGNGNVYVADPGSNSIQKWTAANPNYPSYSLNTGGSLIGIFVKNNDIYYGRQDQHSIFKYSPATSTTQTVAGSGQLGSSESQLNNPEGIFIDNAGNIYIADKGNHRIQKWAPGTSFGTTVAGGNGQGGAANQLNEPSGVFVDAAGAVYIADKGNNRIQKWNSGELTGTTVAYGNGPTSVSVDAEGIIFILDKNNHRIQRWVDDAVQTIYNANSIYEFPSGMFLRENGDLYVSQESNHQVLVFKRQQVSPTYTPTAPGDYVATTTTLRGCSLTSNTAIVKSNLSITTQPVATQTVCLGAPIANLTIVTSDVGSSYQWYRNSVNSTIGGTPVGSSATYKPSTLVAGTFYYFVVVTGVCNSVTSAVATVVVTPPPAIISQPLPLSVCQSSAATLSISATNATAYQWFKNAINSKTGATQVQYNASSTYNPSTYTLGTSYYYVVAVGCNFRDTSTIATITVKAPVAVSTQPVSYQVCKNGQAVPLSVSVTGDVQGYQWFSSSTNSNTGGTAINLATSSAYTPTVNTAGTYYYYVQVYGCNGTVKSNVASVTVNVPTAITAQPLSTQTMCQNGIATNLSITASGTGSSYKWFSNTTNSKSGGSLISGATAAIYKPSSAVAGTFYYYAVATGTCGTDTSMVATVVVTGPPAIISQPLARTVCQSSATTLNVAASNATAYQWFKNTTNTKTGGTQVQYNASSSYSPSTYALGTTYYYVVAVGCNFRDTSNVVAVTVKTPVAVATQPSGYQVCKNTQAAAFSIATSGDVQGYQWYSNTVNGNTGGTIISSANTAVFTPSTATSGTFYYFAEVSGCNGTVRSGAATVTVNPSTLVTTQPLSTQTVCLNTAVTNLSAGATGIGLFYKWYLNTNNSKTGGSLISGATASIYKPSSAVAGTFYYYAVATGTCGSDTSSVATVIVTGLPAITTQPLSKSVCQNIAATLTVVASNAVYYQWFKNTTNSKIGGTQVQYNSLSSYNPSTYVAGTYYYFVVATGCNYRDTSNVVAVTVKLPVAISTQPVRYVTCKDVQAAPLSVSVSGDMQGYQWYSNTTNTNTGGTSINGATSASYTPPAATAGTTTYYAVVTGSCGSATSTTAVITVNANNTVTAASSSFTVCINRAITDITHTTSGATGLGNATGLPAGVTAAFASNRITISGTPSEAGTFNYSIPLTGGCGSVNATGTITVNSNTVGVTPSAVVCINTALTNITIATTGATGIGAPTGLPAGVTAAFATNTITVSGTPSVAGTFNYSIALTGGCGNVDATGYITVNALPAASITAIGSTTFCTGGSVVLKTISSVDTWTAKAVFSARSGAVSFSIGSKGYIGTGEGYYFYNDFWEYDPVTNTWTQKAAFGGTPRRSAVGFSIGNKGYIGTGDDGSHRNDFWEYDPPTNKWTQKADYAGPSVASATGFSIGSKGYIGTGYLNGFDRSEFYEYNPASDTWTKKANYGGGGRSGATGFSIGTKGYIGTGIHGWYRNDFWGYDPSSDIWTQMEDFVGTARGGATGFSIGSKGYIGTGKDDNGYGNYFYEYDPGANRWTSKATFGGSGRSSAIGFSIGSKGYIGTGYYGTNKDDFYEYSPSLSYAWSNREVTQSISAGSTGNYSVKVTDPATGCTATSPITTVTAIPNNTVSAASSTPTVCINTAITNIIHTTTGATGIGNPSGLPTGVTASFASVITISGTPKVLGTFNYSIPITGGCGTVSATGTITVNNLPTVGAYTNTSIVAGQNAAIIPASAPTNTTKIVAYAGPEFTGVLTVSPVTGVVTVTNAKQAGTYTVTVLAGSTGCTATATFTLTVTNPACSQGLFMGTTNIPVETGSRSVAVGDFNGDGKQDLAVANYDVHSFLGNVVTICLGDGSGGFSGYGYLRVGSQPVSIAVGEFNGDGKQDIAVANSGSTTVSIGLGYGATNGSLSPAPEVSVGSSPYSVAVGDFNGDGKQDIAAAILDWNMFTIRLGDGAGGFNGTDYFSVGTYPCSIAVGDFNGDGKQDIATANRGTNTISIRIGDGVGHFSGTTNVPVGAGPYSVAVGDFNGDGRQDIAAAISSGTISIRLGDGAGGFSGTTSVSVGSGVTSVAVGDFNGDGKQDIATANSGANSSISIRLGDGTGGFSGTTNLPVAGNPFSVAVGDFNGDGRQDVASANASSTTVAIRLGAAAVINLQGAGNNITNGNTTPSGANATDFSSVCNGGSNILKTYTIQNTGTSDLTLNAGGITVTGSDAAMFTVAGITLPKVIPAGGSATFTVSFAPSLPGVKSAQINVANNSCAIPLYTYAISATVTADNTASTAYSTLRACINNTIPDIIHTTIGATGIGTATGLPAGVTAAFASNTITISGTPSAEGTFNYTIPLTGGCGNVNATGTITVNANNAANVASSAPTVCINSAMSDITHTTISATGIGTAAGLPAGVTASFASDTITITGTPTQSGTFNYSIPLTGGCGTTTATGTITVTETTAITSNPNGGSYCQNATADAMSVAGTSGSLNYQWYSNVNDANTGGTAISGATSDSYTPSTIAPGTVYYYATLTGDCGAATSGTATVVVTNGPVAAITPASASICSGTGISLTASGGSSYVWQTGDTSATITVSPTVSTSYTVKVSNENGCSDSLSSQITVNMATSSQESITSCNSYTWHDSTYTASGDYTYKAISAAGCDSTITLHLTIATAVTSEESFTSCNSYTWHDSIYTTSGTYTFSTTNANGCDSIVTLHLIINKSSSSQQSVTSCNSYIWHDSTYAASGTYTFPTTNANGCDSIAMLNLTISNSSSSQQSVTSCNSYTWNGNIYATSGTYTFPTTNANGCDSIATLLLTINAATAITTNPTGNSYCQNVTASPVSVSASGTGTLVYQWYRNTTNTNAGGVLINGATSASYQPSTSSSGTTYYYAAVSGDCGAVTSLPATVTVNTGNTVSAASSAPTGCTGTSITNIIHTTTGATGIFNSGMSGANGLPAGVSATWSSNTITISGTPSVWGTFAYSIPLTGGCGSKAATGTITVNALPATPSLVSANPTALCAGTATKLNATSTASEIDWYSVISGGSKIGTSASGADFSVTPALTTTYYAEARSMANPLNMQGNPSPYGSGAGDYTLGLSVTPNKNMVVRAVRSYYGTKISIWNNNGSLLASQTVSGTAGTWTVTPLTTPITLVAGTTYRLGAYTGGNTGGYYDGVFPGPFSDGTFVEGYFTTGDAFPTSTHHANKFIDLVYDYGTGGCVSSARTAVTVTVNPIPNATATPASQTICSGSAVTTIAVAGNVAGTIYNWTRNNTTAVTGIATSGSGDITGSLTNTTSSPITVTLTITPSYTNAGSTCTGTPVTATIIINPATSITAQPIASQSVSVNSPATALSVAGTGWGSLTYQWYINTTNSNTGGTAISGAVSSSFTPGTSNPGTFYYYAIVSGSCSPSASDISTLVVNGTLATALHFNGTNNIVRVQNATNIPLANSAYTMEAWIKPSQMGARTIMAWGNYGSVYQVNALRLSDNGIRNYWWGSDLIVPTADLTGSWHHVAVTYNGTTRKIYLDGTEIASDNPPVHNVPFASNFTIGGVFNPNDGVSGEFFDGSIDEVRVWNKALCQTEITNNKNCEFNQSRTGLQAYYKFNQGYVGLNNSTVNTLIDSSGNGNNGTLTNFTLTGTTSNWTTGTVSSTVCASSDPCGVFATRGITKTTEVHPEAIQALHYTLSPNPSKSQFKIQFEGGTEEEIHIKVFDLNGRKLMENKGEKKQGFAFGNDFSTGVYMIEIRQGKEIKIAKAIKIK